ncbi:hypothetical protein I8J29_24405 [Paenibacillus sp. MWE-103]|uniref:Uncharacterized protein n=1 Tax=Paenibacillus artemisiicola TaxID=1172618 RepID=A0ABS3WG68_9BACL|nr:hypothetical protein [Paenibacillus artemisiicola]MBO7747331.1 hypothetical protein [Paenibacillus artemisiicola]
MKRKFAVAMALGACIILLGCAAALALHDRRHADDGVYRQVVNRQGYELDLVQRSVPIRLTLEPAWMREAKAWGIRLAESRQTAFVLERTAFLNGGMTFTVSIRPAMDRSAGMFLSNQVFEEGGGYHYYAQAPLWQIYDRNGRKLDIDVIAAGQGDRQFSFTLSNEETEPWYAQGLVVEYDGIVAYAYAKT